MVDQDVEESPLGREVRVEPGIFIDRRCFLAATAGGLAAAGLLPGTAFAALAPGDSLTFEEFLTEVLPSARRLVSDTTTAGQDAYLDQLARHAVKVTDAPKPSWNDSGQSLGPGTFIGASVPIGGEKTDPFVVLHWRMEAGARIEAHAHTYGNVCTLGLEGAALVGNFEMLDLRDFSVTAGFIARRTVRQQLRPGTVNLVSLDRNYVHGTIAGPQGARGLDITTRIKPKAPTPYLRLVGRRDGAGDLFDAVWTDLAGMKSQDASLLGAA